MPSWLNPQTGYWVPPIISASHPTTDICYTFERVIIDEGGWNIRDPHGTIVFFVELERDPTWRVTGCTVHHGQKGEGDILVTISHGKLYAPYSSNFSSPLRFENGGKADASYPILHFTDPRGHAFIFNVNNDDVIVSESDLTHRLADGHVIVGSDTGNLVIKYLYGAPDAPVLIAAYSELLRLQSVAVQTYDFIWEEGTEETPGRWKISDAFGPLFTAIMHEKEMWKVYDVHDKEIAKVDDGELTLTRTHSSVVVTVFDRDHHTLTFTAPSLISSHRVTFTFTDGKDGDDIFASSEHEAPIGKGTVSIPGTPCKTLYASKGHHAPKDVLVYVAAYVELLRVQAADAAKQDKIDKIKEKVVQVVGKEAGKEIGALVVGALIAGFAS